MTTLWATLIVLGGLIFAHELGHFIVARLCGVEVRRFSLGFGPRLFGFKRGPTDYRLSIVPLGGYVKMMGESLDEDVPPEKIPVSYSHKPVSRRILIAGAGPAANLVLAVIVFACLYMIYGQPLLLPQVGQVLEGYPAAEAGLKAGDLVLSVAGQPVASWNEMAEAIRAHGTGSLALTVERDGRTIDLTLPVKMGLTQDIFGQDIQKPMIGVSPSGDYFTRQMGPLESIGTGVSQTYQVARLTVLTVVKLIQRQIPMSSVGGPIFIAQAAGQTAKAGAASLIFFIGLLSVNLAIINLLPIPVLDGGHLIFYGIEAIKGRPVSLRSRIRAQQVGLLFLLLFFAIVFYNDITRIFTGANIPQ